MKQFSYVSAIVRSCYSAELYTDILTRWKGLALGYVFLVVLITMGAITFTTIYRAYDVVLGSEDGQESVAENILFQLAPQIPDMMWDGERLSMQSPSPVIANISFKGIQVPFFRFDMQENTKEFDNSNAFIMFGPSQLYVKENQNGHKVHQYDPNMLAWILGSSQHIDSNVFLTLSEQAIASLKANKWSNILIIGTVFWIVFSVVWLIFRVMLILFFSLCIKLLSHIMAISLSYESAVRLTAVAITPAILIHTALVIAFPEPITGIMPGEGIPLLLFLIITGLFSWFGLATNKVSDPA